MKPLTQSNIERVFNDNKYKQVVIAFTKQNDQLSMYLEQTMNNIINKSKFPRTVFYECNIEKEKEINKKYNIESFVTLAFFVDKEKKTILPYIPQIFTEEYIEKQIENYQPTEFQGKGHSIQPIKNNQEDYFALLSAQKPQKTAAPQPQQQTVSNQKQPKPVKKCHRIGQEDNIQNEEIIEVGKDELTEQEKLLKQELYDDLVLLGLYPEGVIEQVLQHNNPTIGIIKAEDLCYQVSTGELIYYFDGEFSLMKKAILDNLLALGVEKSDAIDAVRLYSDFDDCMDFLAKRAEHRKEAEKISKEASQSFDILVSIFPDMKSLSLIKEGINTVDKATEIAEAKKKEVFEEEQKRLEKEKQARIQREKERMEREKEIKLQREEARKAELERFNKEKERQNIINRIKQQKASSNSNAQETIAKPVSQIAKQAAVTTKATKCKIEFFYERPKPFSYICLSTDTIGPILEKFRAEANINDSDIIQLKNTATNQIINYSPVNTLAELGIKGLIRFMVSITSEESEFLQ